MNWNWAPLVRLRATSRTSRKRGAGMARCLAFPISTPSGIWPSSIAAASGFFCRWQRSRRPKSILYFRVANIEAAVKTLAAKGVVFTDAPHMIHRHGDGTEEWMAFFEDPEGRPLALMAQTRR